MKKIVLIGLFILFIACGIKVGYSADRNIECGDIILNDTVLTENLNCLSGVALTIGTNDVTLDCGGNTIRGNGIYVGKGINASGVNNVAIKNCIIDLLILLRRKI